MNISFSILLTLPLTIATYHNLMSWQRVFDELDWVARMNMKDVWVSLKHWRKVRQAYTVEIHDSYQLEGAISSYNNGYGDFETLHRYAENDDNFQEQIDFIIKLALELPTLFSEELVTDVMFSTSWNVTLSSRQTTCLVANAFLCTFPEDRRRSYPGFSFRNMFSGRTRGDSPRMKFEKLKFIFIYFKKRKVELENGHEEFIRFGRHRLMNIDFSDDSSNGLVEFHNKMGRIEDHPEALQMDFANAYLGGGVLTGGCVQEEILFLRSPDLIAAMAFTERLGDRDVFVGDGVRHYSDYSGYAFALKWNGEAERSPKLKIVAADALAFYDNKREQYFEKSVMREILKATAAFWNWGAEKPIRPVATGNWGCGAFGGDPILKFVIQLVAASIAERPMEYIIFDDASLNEKLAQLADAIKENISNVTALRKALKKSCDLVLVAHADFYGAMMATVGGREYRKPRNYVSGSFVTFMIGALFVTWFLRDHIVIKEKMLNLWRYLNNKIIEAPELVDDIELPQEVNADLERKSNDGSETFETTVSTLPPPEEPRQQSIADDQAPFYPQYAPGTYVAVMVSGEPIAMLPAIIRESEAKKLQVSFFHKLGYNKWTNLGDATMHIDAVQILGILSEPMYISAADGSFWTFPKGEIRAAYNILQNLDN